MAGKLSGKTAFVSGSSAGIGEATARRLAADGAVVVVHGRDVARTQSVAEAIRAAGGEAHAVTGGLSTDAEARAVAHAVEQHVGMVDILVNNAGGESAGNGQSRWFEVTPAEWVSTYESNVGSMVRMIQLFAPAMQQRGWGRLIQLSSNVVDHPMTLIPDYQAAKAAIRTLTRSLAQSLANTGVTANSVSPGLVVTPNVKQWILGMAKQNGWGDDWDIVEPRAARELMPNWSGRLGYPDDIAAAVAFLASPEAGFVNAANLSVDGGV